MKKNPKQLNRFINDVLAIEETDAIEGSRVAYMARGLVMATLPHSNPNTLLFERRNGFYTLSMMASKAYGLPYGSLPRLLLAWISREAVRSNSPKIELGHTLAAFLRTLKLSRQGGERGDITRLRQQMLRLFTTHISWVYDDNTHAYATGQNFTITHSFQLWGNPLQTTDNKSLCHSHITLGSDFFEELIHCPVPVDFGVLQALRRSPMQIDIYTWLTYRFSFLKNEKIIPWHALKNQFGSDYGNNSQGQRDFKRKFLSALKVVNLVYKSAKIMVDDEGLRLFPSKTHVGKAQPKKADNKRKKPVDNQSYSR